MSLRHRVRPLQAGALTYLTVAGLACGDHSATSLTEPRFAVSETGADPSVRSTVPASAPRDTTIQILVRGSGFDQGSRAVWALKGDTTFVATRIRVNSTAFVNARELIANVTIAGDAELALYDVQVLTSGGKKGIGLELFEVTIGITVLPGLGGNSAGAEAINDAGVIGGQATDEQGRLHAVRWRQERGIWVVEKLPGGLNAAAFEINSRGTLVGADFFTGRGVMVWTQNGKVVELGPGTPLDINDQETVVGRRPEEGLLPPYPESAVVWTKRSPTTWNPGQLLPRLPTGRGSQAIGINHAGTLIVGDAWDSEGVEHAVTWKLANGEWQAPTPIANSAESAVTEVNNNGDFAGAGLPCGVFPGCNGQAMFWLPDGTRLDLGSAGFVSSFIYEMNEAGDLVGFGISQDFFPFPIRWTPRAGVVEDIGKPLGDYQAEAHGINNRRQAVGSSSGDLATRAILWTFRGR
jgi:uncharacterized membrane protein